MPEFTPAPGGPQFRAPGFLQPKTFEAIDRIPQSFDEMFDRVAKAKALEAQQKTQKKNKENALNMMMLQNPDQANAIRAAQEMSPEQFGETVQSARTVDEFQQGGGKLNTLRPEVEEIANQFGQRREQQAEQQAQAEFKRTPKTQEALIIQQMASGELEIDEGLKRIEEVKASKRAPKDGVDLERGMEYVDGKSPADVRAGTAERVEMQPAIGSNAERQRKSEDKQAKADVRAEKIRKIGVRQSSKDTIGQLDDAISQANFWTVGIIGSKLANVNQESRDLKETLDTLFAKAAFDRLQKMRSESKTGGALGAISERELALLGKARVSMEQAQSKQQFVKNLGEAKIIYKRILSLLEGSDTAKSRFKQLMEAGWDKKEAVELVNLDIEEGLFGEK